MKILIFIKTYKKRILSILFLIFLTILCFISNDLKVLQTMLPINITQNKDFDITGDGKKDLIQIMNTENNIDFTINSTDSIFYLSNNIPDKVLFNNNNHFIPKLYLHDISRDNMPEIILQGSKNNKSLTYLFNWNQNSLNLIFSSENNIFGMLNSNNSRTPVCYSISSAEGYSSLKTFMLINDAYLDTTNEVSTLPSISSVLQFIDLVQIPYILNDLPDIFSSSIEKEELSLFWTLDKENYSYSFQNAYFYDSKWNESEEPLFIRWKLSFEKSNIKGQENDLNELILLIDLEKIDSTYKISHIEKI